MSEKQDSPLRDAIEWSNPEADQAYRERSGVIPTIPAASVGGSWVGSAEFAESMDRAAKRMAEIFAKPEEPADEINHPTHYTSYDGIEVIQLTEQMMFNRGNVVKYVARAGLKGDMHDELKDLKKAKWYLEREIQGLKEAIDG